VEKLREWVREDFGIEVTGLVPVHHGADVAADVWQAQSGDTSYAVKWSGGGTDAGPTAAAYLAEQVYGVPGPVRTVTGGLWSEREGRRLSVLPWIAGQRAAETGLTTAQWTAYGGLLAEIHAAKVPEDLYDVLPRLNPINAKMPALARTVDKHLTTPRDELEAELADVWRQHRDLIFSIMEQLEDLSQQGLGGQPGICHADPHLGNVLVTPEQVWLIDWDDVVLAPSEQDLLFMLGGMGMLGPTTDEATAAFFEGYGPVDVDDLRLTYYRSARALEDIARWADQAIHGPDREDALTILRDASDPAVSRPWP
jgi:spectinomycin phosphotransferase